MTLKQCISAALAAAVIFAGAANAQNQMASPSGQMLSDISIDEFISKLGGAGITAELMEGDGQSHVIKAATPGGATFFLYMRTCEGAPLRCELIQPSAYFNATGVTLSQINEFMVQRSASSYAVLLPNGIGAVSTKIWLVGGVTQDNLFHELAAFLYDADNFISSIQPGTAAQVSFKPTRNQALGHFGAAARPDAADVNSVGVNAPVFMTDSLRVFVD